MKNPLLIALILLLASGSISVLAQTPEEEARERQLVEQLRTQEFERARAELEAARARVEIAAQQIAVRDVPAAGQNYRILLNSFARNPQAQIGAALADADGGALITEILDGMAADDAGLKVGDLIESIDDIDLDEGDEGPVARLVARLSEIESGDVARLGIERGGERLRLDVGPRTADAAAPGAFFISGDRIRIGAPGSSPANLDIVTARGGNVDLARVLSFASSPWGEMELVPMTASLGRYFDTEEGLLVVRAPADDTIGIEDGDVILAIGGRVPNSPEHAIRILGSFEPGETIEFSLMRRGRRDAVEYVLPERPAGFTPLQFQFNRLVDPVAPVPFAEPVETGPGAR